MNDAATTGTTTVALSCCDPAAERLVISGILTFGNEALLDVADIVTPGTFVIDSNEIVFRCLEHLLEKDPGAAPDLSGVLSAAKSLGLENRFDDRDELRHLRALFNTPVRRIESVRKAAAKIRKLEIARLLEARLLEAARDVNKTTGDEPLASIVATVENPIFELTSSLSGSGPDGIDGTRGVVPMGHEALDYVTRLMDEPRDRMGIPTGFPQWDEAVGGGLRPGCLDIWAARQKTGKSLAVDNIAWFIASGGRGTFQPIPVLNVDLEMTREEHLHRVLARISGLRTTDIEKGVHRNDKEARERLEQAAARLAESPYDYLCAIGMPIEEILAHVRRWVVRKVGLAPDGKANPCVVLYDWLKLTSQEALAGSNLKEYQLLGFVTSGLKNFMARWGVSCLCFAQLNREGIDCEDTRVVRGSDAILDFCSSFTIYKWKSDAELEDSEYTHKLLPIIARHGPGLKPPDYINVRTDYERGVIEEGPTARQSASGLGGGRRRGRGDENGTRRSSEGEVARPVRSGFAVGEPPVPREHDDSEEKPRKRKNTAKERKDEVEDAGVPFSGTIDPEAWLRRMGENSSAANPDAIES